MPSMPKGKDDYVCGNCRRLFRSVLDLYEHGKTCRVFNRVEAPSLSQLATDQAMGLA